MLSMCVGNTGQWCEYWHCLTFGVMVALYLTLNFLSHGFSKFTLLVYIGFVRKGVCVQCKERMVISYNSVTKDTQ